MRSTEIHLGDYLESTCLSPTATRKEIDTLLNDALRCNVRAVCVSAHWVSRCALLAKPGASVLRVATVGFPLGTTHTKAKVQETGAVVELGADEVDMVMNLGALRDGSHKVVREDIESVVRAAQGRPVKVIVESGLLSREELCRACDLAVEGGAMFLKTGTGVYGPAVTVEEVALIRSRVPASVGVKAAGGIRTREMALSLIDAGADRLGTSRALEILA